MPIDGGIASESSLSSVSSAARLSIDALLATPGSWEKRPPCLLSTLPLRPMGYPDWVDAGGVSEGRSPSYAESWMYEGSLPRVKADAPPMLLLLLRRPGVSALAAAAAARLTAMDCCRPAATSSRQNYN